MQPGCFGNRFRRFFLAAMWLLLTASGVRATALAPFESGVAPAPAGRIDELVFAGLQERNLSPANLCSDAVFVRRVYLDVTGTLPTGAEARDFILDQNSNKRRVLIDRLLASDEFADYWTMKWGDVLRIKAEFPINLWPNAAQLYHRWVHDALRANMPCDQFVRELLTASGSNFETPPVNFYRAMQNKTPAGIAQTVALTFMGTRVENWPSTEQANLAAFFANVGYKSTGEWKEEIVYFNPASTNADALNGAARKAVFPGGGTVTLSPERDPRIVFAGWLVARDNPWFAKNLVNRAWSWLLGRGIINEPDDIRPDNPPINPPLLAYLENELVTSGYDLKHVYRLILNSRTYQLSAIPRGAPEAAAANFACYPLRRLDAEVLIDAIDHLTGATEDYSSAIPEPYTFIPDNLRSIALPDGSISSAFLEMFGRPPRDTGQESERNNRITAAQKLWLLNSSQMLRKIEQSRMIDYETQGNKPPPAIVSAMYLTILSRYPTAAESNLAQASFNRTGVNRRQATVDLAWALMNTTEFLYRH
jgi:hypothetical protein